MNTSLLLNDFDSAAEANAYPTNPVAARAPLGVREQQQAAAPSEAATADAEWAPGAVPTTPLPIWWIVFQQLATGFNPMLSLIGDYMVPVQTALLAGGAVGPSVLLRHCCIGVHRC
jgi:hypothetical protein